MKKVFALGILVLIISLSISVKANDRKWLIETSINDQTILLFPKSSTGPFYNEITGVASVSPISTDIIRFAVIYPNEIPTVDLDLGTEIMENVEVVIIKFEDSKRFYGFFYVPDAKIYTIWINNNPIIWDEE